jgi:hypothetical membrane protein
MVSRIEKQKVSILSHILSLSGVAAPVFFLVGILISSFFTPGYSHVSHSISELGARGAPFNTVMNYVGTIPAGILTITFSIAMIRQFHGGSSLLISSLFVTLAGIGRLCAGLFPCDPGCFPITTITGRIHFISGSIALLAGSIAPLFMAFALKTHHSRKLFYASLISGVVAVILFINLISQQWISCVGAIQRLLLLFTYVWVIFIAVSIGAFGKNTYASLNMR